MNKQTNRTPEDIRRVMDAGLSGLKDNPFLASRIIHEAQVTKPVMKKKLSVALVLVIVAALLVVGAVAVSLLTMQLVVEESAVPMARENDGIVANGTYTHDQLVALLKKANENGITLDETTGFMRAVKSGSGYWEEEAIMELCREAFGGNFYTWTLEEQDWFLRLMVDIGFYENYDGRLPDERDTFTAESAEAYAVSAVRTEFGQALPLDDPALYTVERQFMAAEAQETDPAENVVGEGPSWYFTFIPKDIDHGQYHVYFMDRHAEDSTDVHGITWDWSLPYTPDELEGAFHTAYGYQSKWTQAVWQRFHDMLLKAVPEEDRPLRPEFKAYMAVNYPEPAETDLSRERAVELALAALDDSRAVMQSAVLSEADGRRTWMVALAVQVVDKADDTAGTYAIELDAATGELRSIRKKAVDDNQAMEFVPQSAYDAAMAGILRYSDALRIADEAIRAKYPTLNVLDENEFEARNWGGGGSGRFYIHFNAKNISHGDAEVRIDSEGTVTELTADDTPLNGDNLFERYWHAYGWWDEWDQSVWVSLGKDAQRFDPLTLEGRLLKAAGYPEESSVAIGKDKAKELALLASGKRTAEVNTCVLMNGDPNPVWKLRVIADTPDDDVFEIDANTGEVMATDHFRTDYDPHYVLYSRECDWRLARLKENGPAELAQVAITRKFADMTLDFPAIEVTDERRWETQQDGGTIRFVSLWKEFDSYEVELDENGYVLRCESFPTEAAESWFEAHPDEFPEEWEDPAGGGNG